MIGIPIGTQIRAISIQNSYIDLIQQENTDLTPNINMLVDNFTVQALVSYSFQNDLTYMYVIAVEDQPLPTKEFELAFSFNDSTLNEPLEVELWEWFNSLDHAISPRDIRNSIELVMDSKNYYYIIKDQRLFFDPHFFDNSTINCNLTCNVYQRELAPDIIDFQIKLILLEDRSDTIEKGVRVLITVKYDPEFAFMLGIPSILVILNSLVFILKYPDPDIS